VAKIVSGGCERFCRKKKKKYPIGSGRIGRHRRAGRVASVLAFRQRKKVLVSSYDYTKRRMEIERASFRRGAIGRFQQESKRGIYRGEPGKKDVGDRGFAWSREKSPD